MALSNVAKPFGSPDTKVEAFNAVTDEIESVPGFHEYFHADHELQHMPFDNELLLRFHTEAATPPCVAGSTPMART